MPRISKAALIRRLEAMEPAIGSAFVEAFREIRTAARLDELVSAIDAGNLGAIERVLGIDSSALSGMLESVRDVFAKSGFSVLSEIPGSIRPRWDMRNPRAEQWIASNSSRMVAEIVSSQRGAIRVAITEGTAAGLNPRETALDIVGRINPRSGRREGGIIGLTERQTEYVARARRELLGLDPSYFRRERRDRRFDAIVRRAMADGKKLSRADVNRIAGRYSDRLLSLRGETIARTEALNAFNAARDEAFQQAIEAGKLRPQHVIKVWDASADSRTRDTHRAMDGQQVGIREAFTSPSGAQLMHPGDGSLGAPASELIQCRCVVRYQVDMIGATLG